MIFPQVARLELDELLDQLISRARDVQESQSRLRGLLRAYLEVASAVDLEQVLRHIVDATRDLVDARFAALGVVRHGRLVRFLHTGMDPQTVEQIGHLPEGKGVLGRLVDYPEPLRLRDIAQHISSVGFPEHHPQMRSFLGVPIRVGDRVFGNLYLADKQNAEEFTSDDEELVRALAGAAGAAIDNASLYAESGRRQAWQAAMVEITTRLLSDIDPDDALRSLVRYARTLSGADGAAVSVPTDDPDLLRITMADGTLDNSGRDEIITREGSPSGEALAAGRTVVIAEQTDGDLRGTTVAAPMIAEIGPFGVLLVCKSPENGTFDQVDLDMIAGFAAQAGLALQLTQIRHDNELLRLAEDRQLIAEDLRHRVIQRLFGLGLAMQGLAARIGDDSIRDTLNAHVDDVDAIIHDIRAAVFSLRSGQDHTEHG